MFKHKYLSSLKTISLTTTIFLVSTVSTIAYPVENNNSTEGIRIENFKELSNSPCYKNPSLPQC